MVFSQIKAHLRAVSAGTIEEFSTAIGDMCALFKPKERLDAVKAAYCFTLSARRSILNLEYPS